MSYRYGIGNFYNPGPGLIPFGAGAILGLMSIGMVLRCIFDRRLGQEGKVFGKVRWSTVSLILFTFLIYGIALDLVGFSIDTFLLMIILYGIVGHQKWRLTLILSFVTAMGAYLIFGVLLGCQFPKGLFGI